uniref:CTCK domain-containing protein n=2 Tax=Pyxicephalus adspersus TaxID=30357 RepID=A0AAV3AQ83_PYXAD|nr:TPA: hypothetical protein GDO54_006048 [Pyxicephalus adspersus]
MDERALQRKLTWQKAIIKEVTRSHPDQVLPIGHDELKRSRCNALPFIQNIFKENCSPVQITNKFCFGQCNSFYVPGLPGGFSQPCTSCSPVRTRPIVVPLLCHGGRLVLEKVDLVVECGCGGRSNEDTKKEGSGGGFLSVS